MGENLIKLTDYEKKFLLSLLEDGSKQDSTIARATGISKSSASRIRKKLMREKILMDFIPIIDLDKFGYRLFSTVLFQWKGFSKKGITQKLENDFISTPQVVYFAAGESSNNLNYIAMVAFVDLDDYHSFFNEMRKKYGSYIERFEVFFIPSSKLLKQDFSDLAKLAITRGGKNE